MKKQMLVAAAFAVLGLAACGGASPDPDEARDEEASEEETVFDDMQQTKDRARAVEGVTMEHKRGIDEAIEESEAGETEEFE
jgi:uncharacterized lipoprotein